MSAIIEYFNRLTPDVRSVVISFITTVIICIIGYVIKYIYERFSLSYKLRKEHYFKQKVGVKEKISCYKIPLIKAAEDFNDRLFNFSENKNKGWNNVPECYWKEEKRYYLQSFVYRFLVLLYWIDKAESSLYSFDFTLADKKDKLYLKYIKTLKTFFCESSLLKELEYDDSHATNHFYNNELSKYIHYIEGETDHVLDYNYFILKFRENNDDINPVIKYITDMNGSSDNLNYNIMKSFHLFLMLFLNKYGLDYHYTKRIKYKAKAKEYGDIKIKRGLYSFLENNKLLNQSYWLVRDLDILDSNFLYISYRINLLWLVDLCYSPRNAVV